MRKKKNISDIKDCYGCGVCAVSCPQNIIAVSLNKNGFYEPKIFDPDKCINCGICIDVCSFAHDDISLNYDELLSWGGWSNNKRIREICSSGGIGFEVGRQLIKKGYIAVGCRYNIEKQIAEHYLSSSEDEFTQSIGSKYIQSYLVDALKLVREKTDKKIMIVGTPCQIDSIRRMIRKYKCEDSYVLMDFFCHGVPSMNAWKAYIRMWEKKIGKISYVSWRNKFDYGWHDSWLMGLNGSRGVSNDKDDQERVNFIGCRTKIQSRRSQGDLFYKLFLGDICLGPQCQKQCKFKYDNSSADIRIGDLWGSTYQDDENGVSAVISFTQKGKEIISGLKEVTLKEHPFERVAEGQMKRNAKAKEMYGIVMWYLRKGYSVASPVFTGILLTQRIITRIKKKLRK